MLVRDARADDAGFLRRMLLEAAYWRPGVERPAAPDEALAPYHEGWGRDGDVGLVAQAGDVPVGAAWCRRFDAARPGYGFVAGEVPELVLAVERAWRGQGIGTRLLGDLIERAGALGLPGLSLSVGLDNPVIELYRRHGFEPVDPDGGSLTMYRKMRESSR